MKKQAELKVPVTIPSGKPIQPGLGGLIYAYQLLTEAGYTKEEQLSIIEDLSAGKEVTLMVPTHMVNDEL